MKRYVGGGIVVVLVFLLGDHQGWFERGEGPKTETGGETANTEEPVQPKPRPKPQPKLQPKPQPKTRAKEPSDSRDPSQSIADAKRVDLGTATRTLSIDAATGILSRFEQAMAGDRLDELARLVDSVRSRPPAMPKSLHARWRVLRSRADLALDCGKRLHDLIGKGQILAARRLLAPLRGANVPGFVGEHLQTLATDRGWPSLTKAFTTKGADGDPDTSLARRRKVRFLRKGVLREGRLWRSTAVEATVRVSQAAGYTYPSVARHLIEPIDPSVDDALRQGLAAAQAGDALGVVLWCCYLSERKDEPLARRLRELLR